MLRFWIVPFGFAIAVTLLVRPSDSLRDTILTGLIAINLIAFLTYGYDKAIAGAGPTRVPEIVLLALAAAGGWPLAYLSMRLFHHKTSAEKAGFRTAFWLLVVVDIVLFVTNIWPRIESQ